MTPEQRELLHKIECDGAASGLLFKIIDSLLAEERAAERERCKGLCYQMAAQFPGTPTVRSMAEEIAENIACGATELGKPAIPQTGRET